MQLSDILKPREESDKAFNHTPDSEVELPIGEPWIEHQELQREGELLWLVLSDGPTLSDDEKQEE